MVSTRLWCAKRIGLALAATEHVQELTAMSERVRIAAIDIGSDTVHLLVADVTGSSDGPLVRDVEQRGELIELGRRVATTGAVGKRAATQLEAILVRYLKVGRRGSDRVVIGATEALRRATDGPALVARLSGELGEPVRVLSGAKEAALGLAGVVHRLDPAGTQLLIDSGGASTEVTITDGRRAVAAASLPVGAALLGAELRGDPPAALGWALAGVRIGAALSLAPAGKPSRAWATGGSAHNLGGLERTKGRSGDQCLAMAELSALAARLLANPARKLARRSGEDPARVAILPPGLLIIAAILAHYGLDELTVVPEGLRQGMVAAAFENESRWWQDPPPKR
jgi:exopolyphosphatase/guanosine-5'-triphosphate,3'-diphosphate pyrophosphatase